LGTFSYLIKIFWTLFPILFRFWGNFFLPYLDLQDFFISLSVSGTYFNLSGVFRNFILFLFNLDLQDLLHFFKCFGNFYFNFFKFSGTFSYLILISKIFCISLSVSGTFILIFKVFGNFFLFNFDLQDLSHFFKCFGNFFKFNLNFQELFHFSGTRSNKHEAPSLLYYIWNKHSSLFIPKNK
jgi:hypothetical protein